MSGLTEALEAWRQAVRDLDATTPWTAPWLRARMIEEERRLAYQVLAKATPEPEAPDVEVPVGPPAADPTKVRSV
jgi:hypothetical protein